MSSTPTQSKLSGYSIIGMSIGLTLLIWLGSKWYFNDWFADPYKYVAKTTSLTVTVLMAWNFVLATRWRWVEDLFGGLDKVYQAHSYLGISTLLILLHPLFLALNRLPNGLYFASFFGFQALDSWYLISHNLGIVILVAIFGLLWLSLYPKLPYHIWKSTHAWFGPIYALIILHVVLVDADIARYPLLAIWMYGWMLFGLSCFIYIRWLYTWVGPHYRYVVESIEPVEGILEIWLRPLTRGMSFRPSQFVYVQFENSNIGDEAHPYSIACAPSPDGRIKLGVKQLGDYTRRLQSLQVNDSVKLFGPYGKFSDKFLTSQLDCVFIGGGIGITPFLSMWETALNTSQSYSQNQPNNSSNPKFSNSSTTPNPRVNLFYVNKNELDASFDNDIRQIAIRSQYLGFGHHEFNGHQYELYLAESQGFITADYISRAVGGLLDKNIFICGPKPMTESLITQLQTLGVKNRQIITENFELVGKIKINPLKLFKRHPK